MRLLNIGMWMRIYCIKPTCFTQERKKENLLNFFVVAGLCKNKSGIDIHKHIHIYRPDPLPLPPTRPFPARL